MTSGQVEAAGAPAKALPDIRARETARAFEAVFVGQMMKLMLEGVDQGELSGGHAEAMFRGVMAEEMGREIARGRGIGLADAVLAEIARLQQAQDVSR